MEKIYGATGRQDGLYRIGKKKWELIYGFGKDSEDADTGWNYRQRFTTKPTEEEIKAIIIEQINAATDAKILQGYRWKGKGVWLSSENQFNFKAAYDMATMSNGSTLPVTFKLGETEEGTPVYHQFTTMEEFTDFYVGALQHITATLAAGWKEKDELDPKTFRF